MTLLHALSQFGSSLNATAGFDRRLIHSIIQISAEGTLQTPKPEPLFTVETRTGAKGKVTTRKKRGRQQIAPARTRTRADAPILFADSGDYTLGLGRDPDKAARRHAAYRELLDTCVAETADPLVKAVILFYESGGIDHLQAPDTPVEEDPWAQTFLFLVDGREPWANPEVADWWARYVSEGTVGGGEPRPCLVCGRSGPVARIEPEKIRPVPGANTAGAALVSINQPAFEWFGRKQGDVAPICQSCSAAYTRGLNTLVRSADHRFNVGKGVLLFWAEGVDEQPTVLKRLMDPTGDNDAVSDINAELRRLREGARSSGVNIARFHSVTLGGNAGRLTVVDWIDVPLADVLDAAQKWSARTQVDDRVDPIGIRVLAQSLLAPGEDIRGTDVSALLRAALLRRPLPAGVLSRCLQRCRVGMAQDDTRYHVTRPQAALLRLVLEPASSEEYAMLDETRTDTPYVLGRILALCGQVQWAALGVERVGTRYYGSASTRPASVFSTLIQGAHVHLANPESGRLVRLDQRLGATLNLIDEIPATLTLREQARFALGYFHERNHLRSPRDDAASESFESAQKES